LRRRQGDAMGVQRASIWLSPTPEQPVRVPERPGMLVYGSPSRVARRPGRGRAGMLPSPWAASPRARCSRRVSPPTS
jgi:hypothetical protein